MLAARTANATAVLDIQTGGGEVLVEVLARVPHSPALLAATESWPPNIEVASRALRPLGVSVVAVPDNADLPFPAETFDLVISRHPTVALWEEIARVLQPGATYFSQQVGAGSVRELTDAMVGPQPVSQERSPARAVAAGWSGRG